MALHCKVDTVIQIDRFKVSSTWLSNRATKVPSNASDPPTKVWHYQDVLLNTTSVQRLLVLLLSGKSLLPKLVTFLDCALRVCVCVCTAWNGSFM